MMTDKNPRLVMNEASQEKAALQCESGDYRPMVKGCVGSSEDRPDDNPRDSAGARKDSAEIGEPSPGNSATLQQSETSVSADREQKRRQAWERCESLARKPRILDHMAQQLEHSGLVGEERAAKLLFLVLTGRLLEHPLCATVNGPSSAGKNFVVGKVLKLFPQSAFYRITGMSEKALAYGTEPLVHRTLVIEEAAGLAGGTGAYLMRSLISEGRLRYETVENVGSGLRPRVVERDGPTGLLVTTTAVRLEPELETRLFSVPISDSQEQTRAILQKLGERDAGLEVTDDLDAGLWHALQTWLELSEQRVTVPYAKVLAELVPPLAVRLRRDFPAVLGLIKAHAVLHQSQRDRDAKGRIIATPDDYKAIYELVHDLIATGLRASVSSTTRETVAAVRSLECESKYQDGVPLYAVSERLRIDKSSASRRVDAALTAGYLINEEDRKGLPFRLKLGEPLPDEIDVLPNPDTLVAKCCGVVPIGGKGGEREDAARASLGVVDNPEINETEETAEAEPRELWHNFINAPVTSWPDLPADVSAVSLAYRAPSARAHPGGY